MQEPIFISIIMAVHNGEKFISRTLQSVLEQSYGNFEVIIVDDDSTDRTVDIVHKYKELDCRVHIVHVRHRLKPSIARNHGISFAKGDWIAVCDADDIWIKEKLQIQVDFIRNWSADQAIVALGSAGNVINESDKVVSFLPSFPNTLKEFNQQRESCEPFMIHHSSVIFDKAAFHLVGQYRDSYIGAEDCDLFTRLAELGAVLNIDQSLFLYRKHLSSWMLENTVKHLNNLERIKENTERRRRGLKELSYEDFVQLIEQKMTNLEKKNRFRMQKGKFFYRVGAINLVNGRYFSGFIYLTRSLFYEHTLILKAIRRLPKFHFSLPILNDNAR